jgi:hypothetical protein
MRERESQPRMDVAAERPDQLESRARSLRERSLQCSELAETSVTPEAKEVLSSMAVDLEREAEELERALVEMRRVQACASGEPPAALLD